VVVEAAQAGLICSGHRTDEVGSGTAGRFERDTGMTGIGMIENEGDWLRAIEKTWVVRFPRQSLATFGVTNPMCRLKAKESNS